MAESQLEETSSSLNDELSGIIGEYSIPHIAEMNSEALTQSQYAKVIFHDIADTYSTDSDVCCQYSLTAGVTPMHGDRIALYRVGWSSVQEYLLFEWAPEPQTAGQNEFQVLFKASTLPKDASEFYQLCYLTSESAVRGASVPFQFRHPQDEDLCVVEGPGDMAVVRSRSALAEEKLRQAVKVSVALRRDKDEVEKKLQDLTESYDTVTKELQEALQQVSQLETAKQDKEHLVTLLRSETSKHADAKQYRNQTEGLQAMLEALTQSKELVAQELRSEQLVSTKLRQELEQAKKQIDDLQKQIQELGMEKQTLEDLLEQSLATRPPGSSAEGDNAVKVAQLQQDKEKLLAELTRAAGTERDLTNMRNAVQKRTEECGALQQQLKNARLTLHERDTNLSERTEEVKLLQRQLSERDGALRDIEARLAQAEQKGKQDESQVNEGKRILAKRVIELEREKTDLEKFLQEARSRADSVNSFQARFARLEIEKTTTESQLKEAASSVILLRERVGTVKARLKELDYDSKLLELEMEQVMQTCEERREELATLQQHLSAQEQRLRDSLGISAASESGYYTHELRCTKGELRDVEFFLESSEMRSAELKVRMEEMDQEKTALEQQLEQSESLREKHIEEVQTLERKLSNLTRMAAELAEVTASGRQPEDRTTSASTEQDLNGACNGMLQDLKKRLQLAATEYQKLYHEKQKSERRLTKLLTRKGAPSPSNGELASEPAVVEDLLSLPLSQGSDTPGEVPVQAVTGGPNFCFICPFCSVTFPPGAYDLFTRHFDNHLS